jgi:hypothetical protein
MGNIITTYSELTRLHRSGGLLTVNSVKPSLSAEEQKALDEAKSTTRKVLSSGIAGEDAQSATGTVAKIEQISRLSQGDVNATNLKAAVDIGEQLTRGEVQQLLGSVSAPLGAVASVESLSNSIDKTLENPNPQNLKALFSSSVGATTSVGQLGQLVARHTGEAGLLIGRSTQALGKVSSVLTVGVAAMDLAIAGQDVKRFWDAPDAKNFAKMGLGMVAAGASVMAAAKIPGVGTKALVVATLADAGKMSLDVNWEKVYQGGRVAATAMAREQATRLKQEVLSSRLPAGADSRYPRMTVISPLN